MLPDPKRQCLEPLQKLEGIRRAEHAAKIAKERHPRLQRKGNRAERRRGLGPYRPMIGRVGAVQGWLLVRMRGPVKIAAIDDDAADRGTVATDIFRQRMHHDGRPVVEGACQKRCCRVVDDERDPPRTPDLGDLGDGKHLQLRIRQRLGVVGAGSPVACLGEILRP